MKRGFGARAASARSKASLCAKESLDYWNIFDDGQVFSPFLRETPLVRRRAMNTFSAVYY